ncbi:AraC family transcriptional regulator [Bradyrhizobium viridifuturi]|uniref:AraC family transcriptional regulator n=1 Tax=Bradyrhizobium sp. TaxID=376 RepID=UPI000BCB801A|nr:helix-turn-helix transcriptional regulator [uncultured Bradyrhizobium sp.]MBR1018931.1 AraC family transcriptional regulator [Bradyrhizobium viridifuturi]OYU60219.1 MAG: AraC family transcriptional regulator [Bradyrhizobium sp. PARBB1]PSO27187.1 AraC family transcriptional regulator [Bradyrhizobium sp. MOS004]QRI73438.1 AraC family transcriptional regulator [Bradyrhizobium sp. PSBB068]MBR1042698.1 AraC family transcriptional regulator [Bradyrhizobium viridifuturi]
MRGLAYLERYPVVHSRDSEFARDKLYSAYGATGFEARNDGFGIRANFAQLTSIGLAFCSYNSAVSLSFPEADFVRQFFSIQGDAKFSTANRSEPIGAWSPFVSAESRLRLDFEAGYRQLVVRVDAKALERSLKSLLGDASDRKLTFSGDAPDSRQMSFVRQGVFQLAQDLETFGPECSPMLLAELERSLILRFLLAHRHNFTDRLQGTPPRANRSVVNIVETFIETNWDKPIDAVKLASVANVSARTMFREFALAGHGSPAQFAKRIRLQRAAECLRQPDELTTVTGVALRCGFQNLGRFSFEYARLIGELPSETLRQARGRL